jgi:hypothetical protein
MTTADGNPFAIEIVADLFGAESIYDEGENGGFFLGGVDEAQPWNAQQCLSGIDEKRVLMACNIRNAHAIEVINGCA